VARDREGGSAIHVADAGHVGVLSDDLARPPVKIERDLDDVAAQDVRGDLQAGAVPPAEAAGVVDLEGDAPWAQVNPGRADDAGYGPDHLHERGGADVVVEAL